MNMKTPLQGKSILIVDDEAELCEILAEEFTALGATVRTASGGQEAYRMFETSVPDVILSDVRMSGGNGIELLNQIRKVKPQAPPYFFLLTGYTESKEALLLSADGQEIIAKPYRLKTLKDRVIAVVGGSK
jgi:CheY-like chemotaxis protein